MTAFSASRLAWISPKMAKRMSGVAGGWGNINLLVRRNIQFFLQNAEPFQQGGKPLLLALLVKLEQSLVRLAFVPRALGQFVGRKAMGVNRRAFDLGGIRVGLGGLAGFLVLIFVESAERDVERGHVRIVGDGALKIVLSEIPVFPLRLDPERFPGLLFVVIRRDAGVVRHLPGGRVPEQDAPRL